MFVFNMYNKSNYYKGAKRTAFGIKTEEKNVQYKNGNLWVEHIRPY